MFVIVLYVLGCVVCGIMGRKTAWGFIGHFFLALVITPLGDFFVQLAGRPASDIRRKIERMSESPDDNGR